MTMHGADVAALRGFARKLGSTRGDVDATRRRLDEIVNSLDWRGGDRDRFVDEWRSVFGPGLAEVSRELNQAASQARYHAQRQEQASRR